MSILGQAMSSKRKFTLVCAVLIAALPTAWAAAPRDGLHERVHERREYDFCGSAVRLGYQKILAIYRKHYNFPEQMGRLTFPELDVRLRPGIDGEASYAVVNGRFHFDRKQHGGVAMDDGVFSLVWQKTSVGWKIIPDHTS